MKIAINGSFFIPKGGGIKEYIENLINNLIPNLSSEDELLCYIPKDQYEFVKGRVSDRVRIKKTPFNTSDTIKRSILEQFFWLKEEHKEKFHVFHSPFLHSPFFRNAKIVITVHDLRICHFPETYTRLRYIFLKLKVPISLSCANHIIAISNFTKNDIIRFYGIDGSRVTVIHEAINKEAFNANNAIRPERPDIVENNFLLYVSHIEPRKNHLRLINAFLALKIDKKYSNLTLVLVGKQAQNSDEVLSKIKDCQDIIYLDFVEFPHLIWLYKNAKLFVYPSYFEGFGFPPLEAASLNTISAVSQVCSLPEICEDSAFYFDPYDVDDIKRMIDEALSNHNERNNKFNKLTENLSRFSWNANAKNTLQIYRRVITE